MENLKQKINDVINVGIVVASVKESESKRFKRFEEKLPDNTYTTVIASSALCPCCLGKMVI